MPDHGERPRTEEPLSRQLPGEGPLCTPQVLLPSFPNNAELSVLQPKRRRGQHPLSTSDAVGTPRGLYSSGPEK